MRSKADISDARGDFRVLIASMWGNRAQPKAQDGAGMRRTRVPAVCARIVAGTRPFAGLEQVILVGRLVSDHHRVADDE